MTCTNCQFEFEGKYCPECGQKADTRRITWAMVLQDLVSGITNVERGFWYNLKALTLRPGAEIESYLQGRWKTFYHPLKYALVSITLMTILANLYFMTSDISAATEFAKETPVVSKGYQLGYDYGRFLKSNQKFLWIANILFFSFPFALFVRRYSFAEWLTINAFILGHSAFLYCLIFWIYPVRFLVNPILYGLLLLYYTIFLHRHESLVMSLLIAFLSLAFGMVLFIGLPMAGTWIYQSLSG
ncbi:MAG: DUF3667 domain-containing protein [Lewinellaceae bacterium]|nr:DUF3667 domain-containing protein [Saprospiraceae bacterium]MCB9313261.1 DUF3667 domain-containing protein [Lewinellaceae bacterium]HRW75901.1 DUF3667 domain-containing protein [Saprospiraceae bacterium]